MTREEMIRQDITKTFGSLSVCGEFITKCGITTIVGYNTIFEFRGNTLLKIQVNGYDINTDRFFEIQEEFNEYPYTARYIDTIDLAELSQDSMLICKIKDEALAENMKRHV